MFIFTKASNRKFFIKKNLMKENIKKSFDKGSWNYDKFNDIQRQTGKKLVDFFLQKLKKNNYMKNVSFNILDLGCGTGDFSKELIKNLSVRSIQMLDLSQEMINISKTKVKFCEVKFSVLDFDNFEKFNKFNLVVSNMSLHWSENIFNFYIKVVKQLCPGSFFLFSIPNSSSFMSLKNLFKKHNRDLNLNQLPETRKILDLECNKILNVNLKNITLKKKYKHPLVFLNELKKIGANFSINKSKHNLFFLKSIQNFDFEVDYVISCFLIEKK